MSTTKIKKAAYIVLAKVGLTFVTLVNINKLLHKLVQIDSFDLRICHYRQYFFVMHNFKIQDL